MSGGAASALATATSTMKSDLPTDEDWGHGGAGGSRRRGALAAAGMERALKAHRKSRNITLRSASDKTNPRVSA